MEKFKSKGPSIYLIFFEYVCLYFTGTEPWQANSKEWRKMKALDANERMRTQHGNFFFI